MGRHRQKTILGSGTSCIIDNMSTCTSCPIISSIVKKLGSSDTACSAIRLDQQELRPIGRDSSERVVVGRPQRLVGERSGIRDGLGFRVNAFQVANQEVLAEEHVFLSH